MTDQNGVGARSGGGGGGGGGGGTGGTRRYAIDVRVFLAVVTTAMAFSFLAGVAFGPTPAELDAVGAAAHGAASSRAAGQGQGQGRQEVGSSGADAAGGDDDGVGDVIRQPRRLPTAHSAELGPRVRRSPGGDIHESHVNLVDPTLEDLGSGDGAVRRDRTNLTGGDAEEDEEDEDEHLPQGQHLLVDIKNVDHDFLNSETRLASAMVEAVSAGGLTLLSYHCHSLQPKGVSCVGVLLESHVSFHTWPDEGVITLDLFTCGSNPLLPVVPTIERLFGIPRAKVLEDGATPDPSGEKEEIVTLWSHELRGFRHPGERKKDYLDDQSDLAYWVVSPLDIYNKTQIVSTSSKYQRIDIWDLLDVDDTPTYQDAMRVGLKEGDPRWLTNEVASPERLLFLDGTIQSMSENERTYHEALVHPALFAHPDPRRVAIVGGGEGATLREVLKHKTVNEVIMIEIDDVLVDIAREHLPFMSDCSNLRGAPESGSCFDDPRATVVFEDGRRWFVDRFGDGANDEEEEPFDVIILDALDPKDDAAISDDLYTDAAFLSSLFNSLTPEGVVVVQAGAAPNIHDPKADVGVYARRERMFNLVEADPAASAMLVYEEAHCGFIEPHSFLLVCRSSECRRRWYADADAVDFWIYERIVPAEDPDAGVVGAKEELAPLVHYDGATQRSYRVPPRAWETVYCRREPKPFECDYRGLDPDREMFDFGVGDDGEGEDAGGSFEFRTVKDEDDERTGVYALVDIPAGSYVGARDLAASFSIRDESVDNLRRNAQVAGTGSDDQSVLFEDMLDFVDSHGHRSMAEGSGVNYVEIGGTFLMRRTEDEAEANVGRWMPPHPSGKIPVYSPVYERHTMSFDLFLVATRDIRKGEEVVKHEKLWDL